MIHLVTLNPALDVTVQLKENSKGKIGNILYENIQAGGKGINIARFLNKMKTSSITWLGTGGGNDPTHLLYRSLLQREGLTARFLSKKKPVRFNVVIQNGNKSQKYNHPGYELDLLGFNQLYQSVNKKDFIVLTGRLPEGINSSIYNSWIKVFNRMGSKTLVDTSGKALKKVMFSRPGFIKINVFELSEALGRRFSDLTDVARFLPNLMKLGLNHGSITNGAEVSMVWCGHEAYFVRSTKKVKHNLIVGAGDGYMAGYLFGLISFKRFIECPVWDVLSVRLLQKQESIILIPI